MNSVECVASSCSSKWKIFCWTNRKCHKNLTKRSENVLAHRSDNRVTEFSILLKTFVSFRHDVANVILNKKPLFVTLSLTSQTKISLRLVGLFFLLSTKWYKQDERSDFWSFDAYSVRFSLILFAHVFSIRSIETMSVAYSVCQWTTTKHSYNDNNGFKLILYADRKKKTTKCGSAS